MFNSSSRQGQRLNHDGSWNVQCYVCNEFISTTFQPITRAICELCRRAQAGEEMTADAIQQYKLAKIGREDVSCLIVPKEESPVKFSMRSLGGLIVEAVGIRKKPEPLKPSTELARSKKRGRIFDQIVLGQPDKKEETK